MIPHLFFIINQDDRDQLLSVTMASASILCYLSTCWWVWCPVRYHLSADVDYLTSNQFLSSFSVCCPQIALSLFLTACCWEGQMLKATDLRWRISKNTSHLVFRTVDWKKDSAFQRASWWWWLLNRLCQSFTDCKQLRLPSACTPTVKMANSPASSVHTFRRDCVKKVLLTY